tara:strand:+ start:64 stop:405 length:342 start_codon:yes stop_codon:yes gene_type:complete
MKNKSLKILDKINIRYFLCLVFAANLADAYLTLTWIEMGVATEANPIMAYLLDHGSEWFITGKVLSVSTACYILDRLKDHRGAKFVAMLSCLLYLGIVAFHILGSQSIGVPLF